MPTPTRTHTHACKHKNTHTHAQTPLSQLIPGLVSGQAEDGHAPAVTLLSERTHWAGDPSELSFAPSQLRGLVSSELLLHCYKPGRKPYRNLLVTVC
jgi:hypothetical protein